MRVLVIKTSSMGDVIHTLPALTDAGQAIPGIRFDWVVEENFAEIPLWHPLVDQVIPVAIRRWRKNLFSPQTRREFKTVCTTLRATDYDLIIDAQGLFKSVWITWLAQGKVCGFDRQSAREPLTAFFYQQRCSASWDLHAVTRIRQLFSQALNYPMPETMADYGIDRKQLGGGEPENYLVFLHGTTWPTKHWPEEYWLQLAKMAEQHGLRILLPWGNATEQERAERIAANCPAAEVLPRQNLAGIAKILARAKAIVAVDTGLGHLAAALDVPTVSLYGPTDPALTGAMGQSQVHLSATFPCAPCFSRECTYSGAERAVLFPPCFSALPPEQVWTALLACLLPPQEEDWDRGI